MRLTRAFGSPATRKAFAPVRRWTDDASAPSVVSGTTNRCDPGAVSYFASRPISRALPTNVKSGRWSCMESWVRKMTTLCAARYSRFCL
jgi:hypothetical protein